MITDEDRIFKKSSIAHCLIFPTAEPDIIIPAKCLILDIDLRGEIPLYVVRIIKFYDQFIFLKRWLDGTTLRQYGYASSGVKKISIPKDAKYRSDVDNYFSNPENNIKILIESPFMSKTKDQMIVKFGEISEYLVMRQLRYLREMTTRKFYKGKFKSYTYKVFKDRMRRAYIDNFTGDPEFEKRFEEL